MISGLIAFTEFGLLALLAALAGRVVRLYREEPFMVAGALAASASPSPTASRTRPHSRAGEPGGPGTADRTELFTQLHILIGLQERDCRVQGLLLCESPMAVRLYAAAWLYGAACALSLKSNRHSRALAAMVAGIISRKTGIRQTEAQEALGGLTHSAVLLACYRAGLESAEFWQRHQFVPRESSLYEAITSNAFI
ncbi:hypothetical protein [Marinobacter sp. VGCF2001]|uniref:hypothetical protein n=1 Tax=Marinobacter sp. VGCF2001 TaxID=3417189 RepID=UPI003CECBCC2